MTVLDNYAFKTEASLVERVVKLFPKTGNNNDLSIHVWLIYFQMKNLKRIQKYNSKCTKFPREK